MIFLERQNIDTDRWNQMIQNSPVENIFCYSWYLDAVAENWGAFVDQKKFTGGIPIPYTKKLGVKQFYNAPYTREYDIFGSPFSWEELLVELNKKFPFLSFRNKAEIAKLPFETRNHQYLQLNTEFETKYRTNAKRLIKKGKIFTPHSSQDPTDLLELVRAYVAPKVDGMDEKQLLLLSKLMGNALKNKAGEIIEMRDENGKIQAAGFFMKDKQRITYLKGGGTDEGKKKGAMFALFDFAFHKYANDFTLFDFGGSDVEQVATFYKKFGAVNRSYYHYTLDNRPWWYKTLKRLAQ